MYGALFVYNFPSQALCTERSASLLTLTTLTDQTVAVLMLDSCQSADLDGCDAARHLLKGV